MTISELLVMPKGMTPEQYQSLLNEKQRLVKRLRTEGEKIDFAVDAIKLLSDELGSERYKKHEAIIEKAQRTIQRAERRIAEIDKAISI